MDQRFLTKFRDAVSSGAICSGAICMGLLSRVALVTSLLASACSAEDKAGFDYFEKHIRPVLVARCYKCHSGESKELGGNLLLDSREGTRLGGDSGKAVVPGNVPDSILLEALRWEGLEMPPDEPLPAETIAKFETWIRMGAPDPRDGKASPIRRTIDFDKARDFWAFQPLQRPQVPVPQQTKWAASAIDRFVLAKLEARDLKPVADARPETLIRRVYFDLIGLPPSPEDVAAFVTAAKRDRSAALATVVDRLLASPRFGERWGRHWLDVVRFGESTGMERNATYPQAWKYRDWVIAALNSDLPFDQFVRQQVAGDLLPYESPEQRRSQLIATGFLAMGPKSLNETNREAFAMEVVDEQIDVTTRAFIGLTAACARCHDHKFDPVPQTEYYRLAGIFRSTDTLYGTSPQQGNRNPGPLLALADGKVSTFSLRDTGKGKSPKKAAANRRQLVKQLKEAQDEVARYEALAEKNPAATRRNAAALQKAQKQVAQLERQIKKSTDGDTDTEAAADDAAAAKTQPEYIMAVLDTKNPSDTELRVRGEPNDLGDRIPRGFLTVGSVGHVPTIDPAGSGRLELADWLTQQDNPLTARVAVNRIWQHLFGRGIVVSVDNFGATGDRPTHPELLDYLAADFVANDWSVKSTIRQIMLTHVYQLAGERNPAAEEIDPDNSLLWRANHRRLEAEAIRDALLAVSGEMNLEPAKGSPVARAGDGIVGQSLKTEQFSEDDQRRSVYLPIVRGSVPEMLAVFDFPEPSIISGQRDVTTVATQALYMLNNEFVIQRARGLARRLLDSDQASDADRVSLAYQLVLSRQATTAEQDAAVAFINDTADSLDDGGEPRTSNGPAVVKAWTAFTQALFGTAEFRYIE